MAEHKQKFERGIAMTDHETKRKELREEVLAYLERNGGYNHPSDYSDCLETALLQAREELHQLKQTTVPIAELASCQEEFEKAKTSLSVMLGADEDNSSATYELQKENEALRSMVKELAESLAWCQNRLDDYIRCDFPQALMSHADLITRAEKILGGEK